MFLKRYYNVILLTFDSDQRAYDINSYAFVFLFCHPGFVTLTFRFCYVAMISGNYVCIPKQNIIIKAQTQLRQIAFRASSYVLLLFCLRETLKSRFHLF